MMSKKAKINKNLTATETRSRIFDLLEMISRDPSHFFIISHKAKPKAVLMSLEEFESWKETLEIVSDPQAMKEIEESLGELKEGRYYTLDEVFPELEKRMSVADKGKIEYKVKQIIKEQKRDVSANRSKKGKKKSKKNS